MKTVLFVCVHNVGRSQRAGRVITMGCGGIDEACPGAMVEAEDWALEDPHGKSLEEVRKIRDEIERRVIRLLGEMAPPGTPDE